MEEIKPHKKKKKSLLLVILKKVFNLRILIPMAVILSFNSYAWFIFATKVETGINAKVRAWNVLFETRDEQVVEHLEFSIDEIYPGMTTYTDYATVHNNGDGNASLSFKIEKVNIIGVEFVVDDVIYTSDQLVTILANDFPFKVELGLTDPVVKPLEEESFTINVSWAYESGNDELDTYWGVNAYDYNNNNPGIPSISLDIVLLVDQID